MKRTLVRLLCVALLAGLLTGCSATANETSASPTETPAAADSENSKESDFRATLQKAMGRYDNDTLVMTVNGQKITWDLYYYWLSHMLDTYNSILGKLPEDFSAEFAQGQSLDEFLSHSTNRYVVYYASLFTWAKELGITTEDDGELEKAWQAECDQNGGEEAYLTSLAADSVTKNAWMYYTRGDDLYRKLLVAQYGENGEKITQEQAEAWAQENNYVHVNDIAFLTKNSDGSEMDDTEKAEVYARAEKLLDELRALEGEPEALEAKFDALRNEYSEEPGLDDYPDGYTITTNQMETAFETAAFSLGEYKLSDVIETSGSYHILLGLPIRLNAIMGNDESGEPYTLATAVRRDKFNADMDEWIGKATIVWSDEFSNFSVGKLFE